MNQRGVFVISLLLYLVIFSLISFGIYNIWKLNSKLNTLERSENKGSSIYPVPSPTENPSADWHEVIFQPMNLKIKYPQGWTASSENLTISQYNLPSRELTDNNIYNLIKVTTHIGVLIPGYYDIDLFDKIYNLKEGEPFEPAILNADAIKIQKITSGKIMSGQKYAIFNQSTKGQIQPKAFILQGNSIIILDLLYSNNLGITVLKEMLRTADFLNQ